MWGTCRCFTCPPHLDSQDVVAQLLVAQGTKDKPRRCLDMVEGHAPEARRLSKWDCANACGLSHLVVTLVLGKYGRESWKRACRMR